MKSHDSYLLFDETYRKLSFKDPLPPAASPSPRAISISTMSKAYGLPGIRIGWVAGDKSIIEPVCAVREQLTICSSVVSEEIALAVLYRRDEFLKEVKQRVRTSLKLINEWVKRQEDLEWITPKGGVVGFPRFTTNISSNSFCDLLVKKYNTFVIPGRSFEMNRHFWIGFGGNNNKLKAGLSCIDKALKEIERAHNTGGKF